MDATTSTPALYAAPALGAEGEEAGYRASPGGRCFRLAECLSGLRVPTPGFKENAGARAADLERVEAALVLAGGGGRGPNVVDDLDWSTQERTVLLGLFPRVAVLDVGVRVGGGSFDGGGCGPSAGGRGGGPVGR